MNRKGNECFPEEVDFNAFSITKKKINNEYF